MKFPPYPKSKPSGVEWLGDVPEHWEVKRLSYLATLKSGENITSEMIAEGGDYPVYGGNGLRGNYHKFTHRGHYALIGRQGALCGNINYASGEFWASEHALVVSPLKEFAVVWMGELLRAMNLGQYSVTAAQPGIAAEMIRGLRIPVPPLPEQRSIAAFLDRETGRIDRLVAKKRELIERLKEKRTALISRTVTRGLPPAAARAAGVPANPPLKPSGLDWLGNIPKQWEFKKLRYLCEITTGDKDTIDAVDGGEFPFFVRSQTVERIDSYSFDCEAVLTAGDGVGVGKVFHHHQGKFAVHQRVYVLHNFRKVSGRYLFMFMKEFFARVALGGEAKSTVDSLRRPIFTDFVVLLPPLPEQAAIAAYLDLETAKLDALVGKVEAAVERLQEYRIALITAAVTGKIDVRNSPSAGDSTLGSRKDTVNP